MGHLQNYINKEEIEERAKDNNRVPLQYKGNLKHLRHKVGKKGREEGKTGEGYYIVAEDVWYFRPNGETDEYRIRSENLNFLG